STTYHTTTRQYDAGSRQTKRPRSLHSHFLYINEEFRHPFGNITITYHYQLLRSRFAPYNHEDISFDWCSVLCDAPWLPVEGRCWYTHTNAREHTICAPTPRRKHLLGWWLLPFHTHNKDLWRIPPAPHSDRHPFLLSLDEKLNLALIGSLPHDAIAQVRIHWLLDLIQGSIENGTPRYNFTQLDVMMDHLHQYHLRPGFELMGNPGNIFTDLENITQVLWWRRLVAETARRYVGEETYCACCRYGLEWVSSWRWESWNEPDHHDFDNLNFTIRGFLNYYDSCRAGLDDVSNRLVLGGPGGSCRAPGYSRMCWALLQHCHNGSSFFTPGRPPRIDFISFHKKGSASPQLPTHQLRQRLPQLQAKFLQPEDFDGQVQLVKKSSYDVMAVLSLLGDRTLTYTLHHHDPSAASSEDTPALNTQENISPLHNDQNGSHNINYPGTPEKYLLGAAEPRPGVHERTVSDHNFERKRESRIFQTREREPRYRGQKTIDGRDNMLREKKNAKNKSKHIDVENIKQDNTNKATTPKRLFRSTNTDEVQQGAITVSKTWESTLLLSLSNGTEKSKTGPRQSRPTKLVTFRPGILYLRVKLSLPDVQVIHLCQTTTVTPGQVVGVKTVGVTSSDLLVTWSDADINTRCVLRYEVEVSHEGRGGPYTSITRHHRRLPTNNFWYSLPTLHGQYLGKL
ncbi:Alpha-L-iduronidase-like, partial [Homarus americanus]